MKKNATIDVDGNSINVSQINDFDYICLTDMAKAKEGDIVIAKWLSAKNTIEFLGAWESLYNDKFNYTEFGIIRNESGGNNYTLSAKRWIESTNAIGIIAKTGRYGGTYAHKDIAFEFGSWISPVFKLVTIYLFTLERHYPKRECFFVFKMVRSLLFRNLLLQNLIKAP